MKSIGTIFTIFTVWMMIVGTAIAQDETANTAAEDESANTAAEDETANTAAEDESANTAAEDETANTAADSQSSPSGWSGTVGLTYFKLDEQAAASQNVGDDAFSVDFHGGYYFSSGFAARLGLGLLRFDDKAQFSQQVEVTSLFGSDVETADSEATGMKLYAEAYYQTPPISAAELQLRAGLGYGSIVGADRSIENCTDCKEEDIDIEGGAFAAASILRANWSGDFFFGLSFRQYFSSDIENAVTLWMEYTP